MLTDPVSLDELTALADRMEIVGMGHTPRFGGRGARDRAIAAAKEAIDLYEDEALTRKET